MNFRRFITSIFLSLILFSSASAATRVGGDEEQQSPVKSFFDLASEQLLSNAKKYIGRPYRIGSTGPRAFDCSGFTSYVYKKQNIQLNRTSRDQYTQGVSINKDEVRPGDLVFFGSRRSGKGVGHVGIVYSVEDDGSFKFVHASCKHGVTISRSTDEYYTRMYRGARRILAY
jgi:cell wall-associated NlpC family hydrolase